MPQPPSYTWTCWHQKHLSKSITVEAHQKKEPSFLQMQQKWSQIVRISNSSWLRLPPTPTNRTCTCTHQKHTKGSQYKHIWKKPFRLKMYKKWPPIVRISKISWGKMLLDPLAMHVLFDIKKQKQNYYSPSTLKKGAFSSENAPESISDCSNLKISWGRMPPDHPNCICTCTHQSTQEQITVQGTLEKEPFSLECIRNDPRLLEFQKYPGGECPKTP